MKRFWKDQRGFLDPVTIGVLGGLAMFTAIVLVYHWMGEVRLW